MIHVFESFSVPHTDRIQPSRCCGIKSETRPLLRRNLLYFFQNEQSRLVNFIVKLRCLLNENENERCPWLTTKVYVTGKVPGSLARRVILRVEQKF